MFVDRGVDETRMSVKAFAHTEPKRSTIGLQGPDLEQARAANRRIVIRIEPQNNPTLDKIPAANQVDAPEDLHYPK
jgi:hypothetical protein